ncbi:MAG TPA: hypothetical protein VNJ54_17870 [Plantibacter sp.]|uniref:hypothetical protein n=1 Tax=Plantibacter sp. TaxID=1871045 RepID=UPI002B69468F|nr:hypothetical protein [Plantibacter sp.]
MSTQRRAAKPDEQPRQRRWIPIIAVMVGLGAVGTIVAVIVGMGGANKEQAFLDAIRSDPKVHFQQIGDEQLLTSRKVTCKRIADGETLAESVANARSNWKATGSLSNITEDEYLDNVGALYRAAAASC